MLHLVQHLRTLGRLGEQTDVLDMHVELGAVTVTMSMQVYTPVRRSAAVSKRFCVADVPTATGTPQGSCLGPKDSHSAAESAPGVVWWSRMTVPAGPHQLCKQVEVKVDIIAETVWKPAVAHKYNGIVRQMICMPDLAEQHFNCKPALCTRCVARL